VKQKVASCKRVSGTSEDVQAGASSDQDSQLVAIGVVDSFEDVFPPPLLVDLIEARPGFTQAFHLGSIKEAVLAVTATDGWHIPVEEQSFRSVLF
jgi:hypothetical protein